MIPDRLEVEGFLSYRQRQTIDFTGADLWLLHGPNGSGKSAVFDAIIYALFNRHRGGARDAVSLINNGWPHDAFIGFEFTLPGRGRFRIERTFRRVNGSLRRVASRPVNGPRPPRPDRGRRPRSGTPGGRGSTIESSRQIYRRENDEWVAVEGAQNQTGFDAWTAAHLGLSADSFALAVHLRQGQADRLLDATEGERRDLLGQVVNLHRVRQLHQAAVARCEVVYRHWDEVNQQLQTAPAVTLADVEAGLTQVEQARTAHQQAQHGLDACNILVQQAAAWRALTQQVNEIDERLGELAALLHDQPAILQNYARLMELERAAPLLCQYLRTRRRLHQARQAAADLQRQLHDLGVGEGSLHATAAQLQQVVQEHQAGIQPLAQACQEAATAAALAALAVEHVQQSIQRLQGAAQEPACSTCGQPLTPAHVAQELALREAELAEARRHAQVQQQNLEAANQAHATAVEQAHAFQACLTNALAHTMQLEARRQEAGQHEEAVHWLAAQLQPGWHALLPLLDEQFLADLEQEREVLAATGVIQQFQTVQTAAAQQQSLQDQRLAATTPLAGIAPAAQLSAQEACQMQQQAQALMLQTQQHLHTAGDRQAQMQTDHANRCLQEQQRAQLHPQATRWGRLCELLDEHHLQAHLLRQAADHITRLAAGTLSRLSRGQMCLRQAAGDEVLALEVAEPGGANVRRAACLSGSERFRVAVSLALALGQYASATGQPVRSVIIDEGFGSLDPDNRRGILEEVSNLQDTLDRVLLISHEEEFAEAIPNVIHFTRGPGGTVVTVAPAGEVGK